MISYELVFLVSIVAGVVGALSGMGGGVILIPVLTFCGVDIKRAIALSLLSVIAISNSAASGSIKRHLPNINVSVFLEVFAVTGSLIGAWITIASPRRLLFLLCGGIMIAATVMRWRQRRRSWTPILWQDSASEWLALRGSYYDDAEKRTIAYRGRWASMSGLLMLGVGVISSWLGIGSSALTVVIQDVVMGLPPKVSLTTSHLIIGVMALAGSSIYLEVGLIDSRLVIPVILGVPLGALLGSKLLIGLTNQAARVIFLGTLLVLGVEMLWYGIGAV
ncbi:MAG: sulfite exporter TauE/SafE family protein [Candidatus Omnitrophica bacterium]|nr:sulfite exporter TauE/SafE family protein [Candidatus Omnitrophota bacterium]